MNDNNLQNSSVDNLDDRFQRTSMLIGEKKFRELQDLHVTIIGLGAVGSHAAEAITRMGVMNLRIVDFDIIRESNINRQLLALNSTLGLSKVQAARLRLMDINPCLNLEVFESFFHEEEFEKIFTIPTHIVIDAIDSFTPKVRLLTLLMEKDIPVISSMGAAGRTDPAQIKTGDLFESTGCALASRIRKELRKNGINSGIRCVYSMETRRKPQDTIETGEEEYYSRGRTRKSLGSISFITGIFGYMMASEVFQFALNRHYIENKLHLNQGE